MSLPSIGMILVVAALAVLALGIWRARAGPRRVTASSPQSRPGDNSTGGRPAAINLRLFGTILLLVALAVLTFGLWLWTTGVPDDGRYYVQASNAFELMAKNQEAVDRRKSARLPLIFGGIGIVLGGGIALSVRRQ